MMLRQPEDTTMIRKTILAVAIGIAVSASALSAANAGTLGHIPLPKSAGAVQPPSGGGSSGPHRQPVDPPPQLGSDYSGDSAGGSGGGGYFGDPNHPGHEQF
jgi:hypothetical protein